MKAEVLTKSRSGLLAGLFLLVMTGPAFAASSSGSTMDRFTRGGGATRTPISGRPVQGGSRNPVAKFTYIKKLRRRFLAPSQPRRSDRSREFSAAQDLPGRLRRQQLQLVVPIPPTRYAISLANTYPQNCRRSSSRQRMPQHRFESDRFQCLS